jgi:hypothetical protein
MRKIIVEPYGYDFIRATLYRRNSLFFWSVEQRTHMHRVYIDKINATVEYWRVAKEMSKKQIIHKGFDRKHTIFTEARFYLRGWYFKKILEAQVKRANDMCRITRKKVYVIPNHRGFPRMVSNSEIRGLKRQGYLKKNASAHDFEREALYVITYDRLIEN